MNETLQIWKSPRKQGGSVSSGLATSGSQTVIPSSVQNSVT